MSLAADNLAGWNDLSDDERREFVREQRLRAVPLLRLGLIVSAVAYFDYVTWDVYVGSPKELLPLRIIASLFFIGFLGLTYGGAAERRFPPLFILYALDFAVSLAGVIALSPLGFTQRLPGILFYVGAFLVISPTVGWAIAAYLILFVAANAAMLLLDVPLNARLIADGFLLSWIVTATAIGFYFDFRRRHQFRLARDLSRERKTLRRLATIDPLTGVANRRYFMTLLKREGESARRHERALAVAMLDIDYFKRLNDTYGHDAGDRALRAFAKIIGKRLRESDLFARLGGEEFAIALPETDLDEAVGIADRLRERLSRMNITLDGVRLEMTMSVGVALWRPTDSNVDAVVKRADAALYEAKRDGRNRVKRERIVSDDLAI